MSKHSTIKDAGSGYYLDLHDYYAAKFAVAIISGGKFADPHDVARSAYLMADVMVQERAKRHNKLSPRTRKGVVRRTD